MAGFTSDYYTKKAKAAYVPHPRVRHAAPYVPHPRVKNPTNSRHGARSGRGMTVLTPWTF